MSKDKKIINKEDDSKVGTGHSSRFTKTIEDKKVLFEKEMTEKGTHGSRFIRKTDGKYSYNYIQKAFEEFCSLENKPITDDTVKNVIGDVVVVEEESVDREE